MRTAQSWTGLNGMDRVGLDWIEQIDHIGEVPEIDEVDEVCRHVADRQAQIDRCVHGSIHICMNAYNVAYVFASIVSM